MFDFLRIKVKVEAATRHRSGRTVVYPAFVVSRCKDIMIRGGDFYAAWLEDDETWTTDEYDVVASIDDCLDRYVEEHQFELEEPIYIAHMSDSSSGSIDQWHKYCQRQAIENFKQLNGKIIFKDTDVKREDYSSIRLPYSVAEGDISSYDQLMSVLYDPKEREKLEWAIGAIVSGDSVKIQKFMVLYGGPGTGKSTFLNIVEKLFGDYVAPFVASELADKSNMFSLEAFKSGPLVSIDHDAQLLRISDNTRLNGIVGHDKIIVNEKHKAKYAIKPKSFLFIGTNTPVEVTGAKSGLNRRMIDVTPTGNKLSSELYADCVKGINFELGAIAAHCLDVYNKLGKDYYKNYMPETMQAETDDFYDFILEECYDEFKQADSTTLGYVWDKYKAYCEYVGVRFPKNRREIKAALKDYFLVFEERVRVGNGDRLRNRYSGFVLNKFRTITEDEVRPSNAIWLVFTETSSVFDNVCKDYKAQYTTVEGTPLKKWDGVETTISDIDTSKLHFTKPTVANHIVIDFDIKDPETGEKSLELNKAAAAHWPPTYAEVSKSGQGIHLHYLYDGDVDELSNLFEEDIEIKTFSGGSSLRRKLTVCNAEPITTISTGLPRREKKKVLEPIIFKNEAALRTIVEKNLKKEYHADTRSSIDFIAKVLSDAYSANVPYDLTDLRPKVLAFANNSSNQSQYCVKKVMSMQFMSEASSNDIYYQDQKNLDENQIVFYDVEVFPNLLLVNWKRRGKGRKIFRMINPSPEEIKKLIKTMLVGFNCRQYDNHILHARAMGYSNAQIYKLSKLLISSDKSKEEEKRNARFGAAYNISYADIYDFCSKKQSLKKWEIELGIHHKELGLDWDKPVPEEKWPLVAEYCDNDVVASEAVFEACIGDFKARKILSELSGLPVNATTRQHATKIIFGDEKHPVLVYTDLKTGEQSPDIGGM